MFIIFATVVAGVFIFLLIMAFGYTFKYARVVPVELEKQHKHDSSVSALKNRAEKLASRRRVTCLALPRLECTPRRPAQSRMAGLPRRATNRGSPFIKQRTYFYIKFRVKTLCESRHRERTLSDF